ncbi:MAG: UDP-N-acetylmuramate dehydrogenase, partial [Patescibacteria group bacterium]|nr:UDP-N-acetylmuramate dehydrogenase [Patescibacteria group bacterium]
MEAVTYARDNNLEIFVLGGGSNILVSDEGFDGLVIKLASGNPRAKLLENVVQELSSWRIECWAGDSLANIVKLATENSLTGMEWAAGIPGTVG